jgi:hypothetical protein
MCKGLDSMTGRCGFTVIAKDQPWIYESVAVALLKSFSHKGMPMSVQWNRILIMSDITAG